MASSTLRSLLYLALFLHCQSAVFGKRLAHKVFDYRFPDCTSPPLRGNGVCDTSKDAATRARAIVSLFTDEELIANTVNLSPGVPRLGLPGYEWWSEALHGVAVSPGLRFADRGKPYSYATSFPMPIVLGATFDDDLVRQIFDTVSTEARAFSNAGRAGLDYWTPNVNPFRDPRWGRGQETPGEDPYHISRYVYNVVHGLQGGIDPAVYKVSADCKHFAAYDMENWNGNDRVGFNAIVTPQDLSEYYSPSFQSCIRDAKASSVMCSYNSVNGVPSCASPFLLQTLVRERWGLGEDKWIVSDCDAVDNIYRPHHYASDWVSAAAMALKAGTDIDCGDTYINNLPEALKRGMINRADLERAVARQYTSFVRLGIFDPAASQPYRRINWDSVNTGRAQDLAYRSAVEGIVLFKNDGALPLKNNVKKIAFIGPYAEAKEQMQGNYAGPAPYVISPAQGARNAGYTVTYKEGTSLTGGSTAGFAEALDAGRDADVIIFAGGIDNNMEMEFLDRTDIHWPGKQMDLVAELSQLGKPLIVIQFGGGQLDGTLLKHNSKVNAHLWAGYPGQSGGTALADILSGKAAPAGRLSVTQYPGKYVNEVPMTDMHLRPGLGRPGRTYKWYQGEEVYAFGHGLHYTKFALSWQKQPSSRYKSSVARRSGSKVDLELFDTFSVAVKNTGQVASDYVALIFLNGTAGPAPYPKKQLVGYTRLHQIQPGHQATASLPVTLGSIARADTNGNMWVYGGTYQLTVDVGSASILSHTFQIEGEAVEISKWPQQ